MALSDCAITSGYTNDCRDGLGGIKNVYLCPHRDVATITSSSGNVSAMTMNNGKVFYKFEMTQATGTAAQTMKPNKANGTFCVEQTINIKIPKTSAALSVAMKTLAIQDLMAIVEKRDGTFWLFGEANGVSAVDSPVPFGTAMADFSGYDINLMGEESSLAKTVTSSVITSVT